MHSFSLPVIDPHQVKWFPSAKAGQKAREHDCLRVAETGTVPETWTINSGGIYAIQTACAVDRTGRTRSCAEAVFKPVDF